ncbi:MAG: hypothetical protein HKN20_12850, partial [Gemmatimonadetes bacterium]|nr:hypothetical protein [Gemmatimonadota bacterium]
NDGGGPVTFTHDVEGNVLSRTESGTTRDYVWNHTLILPAISIVRESAADLRYYVLTPGGTVLHSVEASNNARRFYHADEMGSTIFLTDDAGLVTDSYLYTPFGKLVAQTGATDNPFTFHGTYGILSEGDLYHMRARVYDAGSKRFLSRDPLVVLEPRTANFYQAFFNSPLAYIDPEGTRIAVDTDASGRRTFRDEWKGAALFEIYDREFQRLLKSVEGQPPDVRRRTLQPRVDEWLRLERERIRQRARAVAAAGGRDVMRNQRELRDCALLIRKFRSLVYAPARAQAIIDPEGTRRREATLGRNHFGPLPFYQTTPLTPPLSPRPEDMLRCVHPR